MNFRVWVEQVNGDYFNVEAETLEEAKSRAKTEWVRRNMYPNFTIEIGERIKLEDDLVEKSKGTGGKDGNL